MNITVKARHMNATDSIREYVESKTSKLERFYANIRSLDVILGIEADQAVVEIVATAAKKHTFVATCRAQDMYACIDQCMDKIKEQVRRHKDRVRDRQGPPHSESMTPGPE